MLAGLSLFKACWQGTWRRRLPWSASLCGHACRADACHTKTATFQERQCTSNFKAGCAANRAGQAEAPEQKQHGFSLRGDVGTALRACRSPVHPYPATGRLRRGRRPAVPGKVAVLVSLEERRMAGRGSTKHGAARLRFLCSGAGRVPAGSLRSWRSSGRGTSSGSPGAVAAHARPCATPPMLRASVDAATGGGTPWGACAVSLQPARTS